MYVQVHQLNDESRGPTMEAIVSRMKTVRASVMWEKEEALGGGEVEHGKRVGQTPSLRFIAISATIPNVDDVSTNSVQGAFHEAYTVDSVIVPVTI